MSDEKQQDQEMLGFMESIREAGFVNCPVCKNEDGFTWAHSATVPGKGMAKISSFIPGATTVPGEDPTKREPYATQLYMLICDRCSHIMTFSKIHMQLRMQARRNGK